MSESTKARLDATRDAYITALLGREVQDALGEASELLAKLGERLLAEKLHTLVGAVAVNRQRVADTMRERDSAMMDHMLTMYLSRYEATHAQALENRDRIEHLEYCCRVLDTDVRALKAFLNASFGGVPPLRSADAPPPGADDERESHP